MGAYKQLSRSKNGSSNNSHGPGVKGTFAFQVLDHRIHKVIPILLDPAIMLGTEGVAIAFDSFDEFERIGNSEFDHEFSTTFLS
jgi:hypothetical protein